MYMIKELFVTPKKKRGYLLIFKEVEGVRCRGGEVVIPYPEGRKIINFTKRMKNLYT